MVQPKNRRLVTESSLELFINTQAASPVATLDELPTPNSGNMGLIRFVTSENEPYYSNGTTWSSIAAKQNKLIEDPADPGFYLIGG